MEGYQKRVVAEKQDLDEKREKLVLFLWTDRFEALPSGERGRLLIQNYIMKQYSGLLGERIAAFPCEVLVDPDTDPDFEMAT